MNNFVAVCQHEYSCLIKVVEFMSSLYLGVQLASDSHGSTIKEGKGCFEVRLARSKYAISDDNLHSRPRKLVPS